MNNSERQTKEFKSIQKIKSGDKGFRDLALVCVAFANAQGGTLYIGVEDKTELPPENQKISIDEVNDTISRVRSLCYNVGMIGSDVLKSPVNSGEYFKIIVSPSHNSIATTSDAKIYIRIADKCEPVRTEDFAHLVEQRGSFKWELKKTKWVIDDYNMSLLSRLANEIRDSKRVKDHILQMDDMEIAYNYHLIDDGKLTNLGVLWIGSAKQRASISFPLTVQYIVYDNLERKVRKEEWHDNLLNPKELLLDIEKKAIELTYSYEFPDGLFRKQIRHYNPKLLRELLVNAIAHKSYCISSDVTICVYSDRLEISNSGGLPLGITKDNILHSKMRRNPYMIELLSALGMMEGEGSGYDLIYELNAMEAKSQPIISSNYNEVLITQYATIIDPDILPLLDYTLKNYELSQKGYIAFGIIAKAKKISAPELSAELQLPEEERLRSYIIGLIINQLIIARGAKKGTSYLVNPKLIENAKVNIKASLKTLEPHVLKALIFEDLRQHPSSSFSEILKRLNDVYSKDVRKILYAAHKQGELRRIGTRGDCRYSLP